MSSLSNSIHSLPVPTSASFQPPFSLLRSIHLSASLALALACLLSPPISNKLLDLQQSLSQRKPIRRVSVLHFPFCSVVFYSILFCTLLRSVLIRHRLSLLFSAVRLFALALVLRTFIRHRTPIACDTCATSTPRRQH
ncbi:hypothetical protein C8R43DRAFT_1038531 [Mycena crocata]|nr:hypothetical protein C8R43DRAFT_1038531 [Mycena crocata]